MSSYIGQLENDDVIFVDAFGNAQKLIEFENMSANKSTLTQRNLKKECLHVGSQLIESNFEGLTNTIIYLQIFIELMRKPQIHSVLKIGQWSALDTALAETLPKFNEKNSLYSYVPHRPVGKFTHVNFICTEVDGGA